MEKEKRKELQHHYQQAKNECLTIAYLNDGETIPLEKLELMIARLQTLTRDLMELANDKYKEIER